jgi:cholesterol transport system auxiliary component
LPAAAAGTVSDAAPTLVVALPRAAAGYDSQRMIYLRQQYELQYFAHSQWVDTPARMLQPLIAAAVERRGRFRAVVLMPASVSGDYRLETELLRLQQEFLSRPSRVHLSLRATLTEMTTRRVVAWRQFDAVVPAATDDPYGGVVAANRAVDELLEQLAAFCADAAADFRPDRAAEKRP